MTVPQLVLQLALAVAGVFTPIDKAATATIELKGFPDWLEVGSGSLWVSNPGLNLVQRIDPATNKVVAEVKVKLPVAAMAAGYDSLWVASFGDKSIVRIDAKTNAVAASVPVTVADTESSVAAGEGGVWVVSDKKGVLSRIDPETNKVAAKIDAGVAGFGGDIAAGEGAVWVRGDKVLLVVIDPKTNRVVKRYAPAQGSGAVRAAGGKVWVSAHDVNKLWSLDPPR